MKQDSEGTVVCREVYEMQGEVKLDAVRGWAEARQNRHRSTVDGLRCRETEFVRQNHGVGGIEVTGDKTAVQAVHGIVNKVIDTVRQGNDISHLSLRRMTGNVGGERRPVGGKVGLSDDAFQNKVNIFCLVQDLPSLQTTMII